MTATELRSALDGYFASLLPALNLKKKDVSWYNVRFTPQADRLYVRPRLILGGSDIVTLGEAGYERLNGIYQIDVLGVQNTGIKETEDMAENIRAQFTIGSVLKVANTSVHITASYAGANATDDLRPMIPVTVNWYSDRKRDLVKVLVVN